MRTRKFLLIAGHDPVKFATDQIMVWLFYNGLLSAGVSPSDIIVVMEDYFFDRDVYSCKGMFWRGDDNFMVHPGVRVEGALITEVLDLFECIQQIKADDLLMILANHGPRGIFGFSKTELLSGNDLMPLIHQQIQKGSIGRAFVLADFCSAGTFSSSIMKAKNSKSTNILFLPSVSKDADCHSTKKSFLMKSGIKMPFCSEFLLAIFQSWVRNPRQSFGQLVGTLPESTEYDSGQYLGDTKLLTVLLSDIFGSPKFDCCGPKTLVVHPDIHGNGQTRSAKSSDSSNSLPLISTKAKIVHTLSEWKNILNEIVGVEPSSIVSQQVGEEDFQRDLKDFVSVFFIQFDIRGKLMHQLEKHFEELYLADSAKFLSKFTLGNISLINIH